MYLLWPSQNWTAEKQISPIPDPLKTSVRLQLIHKLYIYTDINPITSSFTVLFLQL